LPAISYSPILFGLKLLTGAVIRKLLRGDRGKTMHSLSVPI
jgi:hypothetical protein